MSFSASLLWGNALRSKHISSTLRVQSRTFASSFVAMTGAQFTLYTHAGESSLPDISVNDFIHSNLPFSACVGPGPNPVKAAIALEHLGLQGQGHSQGYRLHFKGQPQWPFQVSLTMATRILPSLRVVLSFRTLLKRYDAACRRTKKMS